MTDSDRPNVIVFPPVILGATIALAVALQCLFPLGVLVRVEPTSRLVAGGLLLLTGVLFTIAGARTLFRHGTNVSPTQPAIALITDGIYRWTRNPMYVGGGPLMFGLAMIFALDWLPLLMIPSWLTLHFGIVKREEQYLARKFGEDYRRYLAQVPRYLGPARATHTQKT
jgi:protein-S-isoprenylcysteine O-methyltransferase Ste14